MVDYTSTNIDYALINIITLVLLYILTKCVKCRFFFFAINIWNTELKHVRFRVQGDNFEESLTNDLTLIESFSVIVQMTHKDRGPPKYLEAPRATCTIIFGEHYLRSLFFEKRQAHTWRHSAALRKELRDSWDTCTSPRYMNSRRDAILWALVPSRITISPAGEGGIPSKSSWKCLLHAARINLCALNVTPGIQIEYTVLINDEKV